MASEELKQLAENTGTVNDKILAEMKVHTEQNEIQIRLLSVICDYKDDQLQADKLFREDWYASKDHQARVSKRTLYFSQMAVLIGVVAIAVELQSKYKIFDGLFPWAGI